MPGEQDGEVSKMNILELQNINKFFGQGANRVHVLKGINLTVEKGDFVAIIGQSGSGKSTLMNIIGCLDTPTSGSYRINGIEAGKMDRDQLAELRSRTFGFIFQRYNLLTSLNARENAALPAIYLGMGAEERTQRAVELLKRLELGNKLRNKPNELSGGQQQRVALARGLVNMPKVLLLDEPLSSLDMKLRKQMEIDLQRIQKKLGITFIYVTHDQDEALSMSDRVAIINNGVIEQIDTPKNLYNYPKTKFVADFIGESNQFKAVVVSCEKDESIIKLEIDLEIKIKNNNYDVGENLVVIIRPEQFKLAKERDVTNCFYVKTKEHIYNGAFTKVLGKVAKKEIEFIIYNDDEYTKNEEVKLKFNSDDIVILEDNDEQK